MLTDQAMELILTGATVSAAEVRTARPESVEKITLTLYPYFYRWSVLGL